MLEGKIVTFAICTREGTLTPIVREVVSLGMGYGDSENPRTPRYCGENHDPDGAGSHALIPSWYGDQCTDLAYIAVALALALTSRYPHYFRLAS